MSQKIKIIGYEDIDISDIEQTTDDEFDDALRIYINEIADIPRLTNQ